VCAVLVIQVEQPGIWNILQKDLVNLLLLKGH